MSDDIFMPSVRDGDSVDLVARWVLMLSHLYYDRGVSIVDDADYDAMCAEVADAFDDLSEHMQQLLGDPDTLRSTGMDVLLPRRAVSAAERLAKELGETLEPRPYRATHECGCCGCDLMAIRG